MFIKHALYSALALLVGMGTTASASQIQGPWLTGDGAIVQIRPCSNGLCGKLVDFPPPPGEVKEEITDRNNEDKSKRDRKVLGINVIWGMSPVNETKWAGMVYDPKRGLSAKATLELLENGKLKLTGCKKVVVDVCKSEDWIRSASK
ncbi:DUF2147 domain-containing protein [Pseudovibrio exalbescens]|uniref:DUF2147 domain-containing protein n=1 Tax=Pseudovibrio exalbescens TaxID=197461 RepID=UPI002366C538|nr:DUF2147 domain-containing protein [Pseudovibrio exalbescens]MDD7910724.1 DUF2147 domain-containing protein [Pseudovibrio exalbescens]